MGYIDDYDWLRNDPEEMGNWHWFLQKGEWVREVKKEEEVKELIGKRTGTSTQWVVTHSGGNYDSVQLEVMMSLEGGSVLYGACGNPNCDLDEPIDFPPCLGLPAQEVKEGDDSWLPFGIEVACIVGYIM